MADFSIGKRYPDHRFGLRYRDSGNREHERWYKDEGDLKDFISTYSEKERWSSWHIVLWDPLKGVYLNIG